MSLNSIIADYWAVLLFYSFVVLVVYLNRKKLTKEAPFIYLYKTRFGLKLMDSVSGKLKKPLQIAGYLGIIVAYLGFFIVSYALLQSTYDLLIDKPGAVGGSPVIPGLPIAGLGIRFPLVIGWISLFIIMIVHEFSHGIIARTHGIKIKSSGIAFFGPILGAFVEPDEEQINKQSHKIQHSVYAAGPVANIILWILCILLVAGVADAIISMTYTNGVRIGIIQNTSLPAYTSGLPENSVITQVNGMPVRNLSSLEYALNSLSPGQNADIMTLSGASYKMTTVSHPNNQSKAYIGILIRDEERVVKTNTAFNRVMYSILMWILELLQWTGFISVNIGLINLFPIFITDGAKILKLNCEYLLKKKRGDMIWKNINIIGLIILLILLFLVPLRSLLRFMIGLI